MEKKVYRAMVELQHKFNSEMCDNYLDKDFDWNNAIIVESGEMLDSLGFKWWAKQDVDMDNVKVEAIDLLHFVISEDIQVYYKENGGIIKKALSRVSSDFIYYFETEGDYLYFEETDIKKLINQLNYDDYDRLFIMKQIFKALNMSNEDAYVAYIVKNCLNKFRQDNGYKEGNYIKMWRGREDNIVAYEMALELSLSDEMFDVLYKKLSDYYSHFVLGAE